MQASQEPLAEASRAAREREREPAVRARQVNREANALASRATARMRSRQPRGQLSPELSQVPSVGASREVSVEVKAKAREPRAKERATEGRELAPRARPHRPLLPMAMRSKWWSDQCVFMGVGCGQWT